ncbi:MAG: hypothetical protein ALECFALPRED_005602 [Alectoria fallacina]|uniref:Cytochrome P450 n=1 Tax=Alectoria fallacina TaxID=1903189 RepID=A0A8H3IMI4_9LECA|nr:MAG: hypothetical protein ALECFALPRED_005602 [Alectoria fallacina]
MLLSSPDYRVVVYRGFGYVQAHQCLTLLGLFCLYVLFVKYRSGLRRIPGPWLASVSTIWRFAIVWKQDMPATSIRLHEKHGPLVRIGPYHVSVADPEALKVIYGADTRYQKTVFYQTAQARYEGSILSNMFSASGGDYHARLRRATGHVYSMTAITELEPLVDSCVQMFLSRLQTAASTNTPFEIDAWLQYYSFDCLGSLSFSEDVGFLSSGSDVGLMINAVDRIFDYVALVSGLTTERGLFAVDKVHARQKQPLDSKDILSRLFEIHKSDPEKLSFREIVGAMSINVFAGHDALAISMRTIFYYLCRYPEIRTKLSHEIQKADAAGLLSPIATYAQAASLPYLSAVINEAFRIHPPVGLILERHVPAGGETISGVHLPEGTVVGINAWVLHQNKVIFGEDAHSFRPERWIEADPEQLKEMRRNMFAVSSHAVTTTHSSSD